MKYVLWPKEERPREKLLTFGPQALSNSELLALFLQTGSKEKSVMDISRELLSKFRNFSGLLNASTQELCAIHGIGPAKCVILRATLELSQRYLLEQAKAKTNISNPRRLIDYLSIQLREQTRELFACLLLNSQLELIHYEVLFKGTLTEVSIHPREIATLALQHHADSVILAHNHPQGQAKPSQADIDVTNTIQKALRLLDIAVHDHIIIAQEGYFSFAAQGILSTTS